MINQGFAAKKIIKLATIKEIEANRKY